VEVKRKASRGKPRTTPSVHACMCARTYMRPSYTGILVPVYKYCKSRHTSSKPRPNRRLTLSRTCPLLPLDRYPFSSAQGKLARELGEGKTSPQERRSKNRGGSLFVLLPGTSLPARDQEGGAAPIQVKLCFWLLGAWSSAICCGIRRKLLAVLLD
jgi:hypothetical protein